MHGNFDWLPELPNVQLAAEYLYIQILVALIFIGLGFFALVIEPDRNPSMTRRGLLYFLSPDQRFYLARFTGFVFFIGGTVYLSLLVL